MNKNWYTSNNEESVRLDIEAWNRGAEQIEEQFRQDQYHSYNPWDTYQSTSYDTQDISQFAPKKSRNIIGKTIDNCHLELKDGNLYLYKGYVKENVANFKVNKVQKITVGDEAIGQLGGIYGYYIEFGNETKGIFTMEDLKPKKLGEKLKPYECSFNFSIKEDVFYDLLGDLIDVLSKDFEEYKLFYNVGWHDKKYSFPNNDINLEFPLYKKNFAYKNSDKSVYNLKATVKLYNKIKEEDIRLLLLGTLISGVLHTRLKGIGRELNKIVLINAPQSDTKVLTKLYLKMFDYNIGNIALSSKENMIKQLIANTKDDVAVIDGNNESDNNQTVKNNIKELEKVFCSGTAINYSDTRKERRVCSSASNLVIFANKMSNYMNTENYIYLGKR